MVCRCLSRQHSVRVLSQKRTTTVLALFATLMFMALETLISLFSKDSVQTFVSQENCIRNTALGLGDSEFQTEGEVIHYGCMTINGTSISHHLGNYSLDTALLTCGEEVLYTFNIGERRNVSAEDGLLECDFRLCSVVLLRENVLYLSDALSIDDVTKPISAITTDVTSMAITEKDMKVISNATLSSHMGGITEESDIRRRALAGPFRTKCDFERHESQATEIPLSIILISAIVWLLSIMFFLTSLVFKGHIFFDFGNPIHWASFAWHDVEAAQGNDPQMTVSQLDGSQRIRITRYA
ncbi:hypothetical protein FGB62_243g04 [Gracilaria domingensis]|nr:hypothetical protein FGB62_243g04 [Gracilaria domingensis]